MDCVFLWLKPRFRIRNLLHQESNAASGLKKYSLHQFAKVRVGEPPLKKGASKLCLDLPLTLMLSGYSRYFGSLLLSLSRKKNIIQQTKLQNPKFQIPRSQLKSLNPKLTTYDS